MRPIKSDPPILKIKASDYYAFIAGIVNDSTANLKQKRTKQYHPNLIREYIRNLRPCPQWLLPHIQNAIRAVERDMNKRGLSFHS
jgi:hypothetical protein